MEEQWESLYWNVVNWIMNHRYEAAIIFLVGCLIVTYIYYWIKERFGN